MAGMLDMLHSTSGFTSENSLSGVPTPPYIPVRPLRVGKRSRLERSDSPASVSGSIHPHETTSPATKPAKKRVAVDNIKVEELAEDVGYMGDVDGILPYETESADSSDADPDVEEDDTATDDSSDEAVGLARKLSQMGCTDEREAFLQERKRRRQRERRSTNHTKRTHSLANESIAEPTDTEALADHDYEAGKRRLRRRTRGPDDLDFDASQVPASPPGVEQHSSAPTSVAGDLADIAVVPEAMDVDNIR
ncbi:hypothetical protein Slin15195_G098450 [Septoria linicola]|uniref:Uncharacterized protein n=1 Tax=Septoria linicola TaxID=215465 RepID=A0A9Q9B3F4_9PEZI|nr:hypothetical protein Slin14017_G061510 [Septoria linicola]USW56526.1 hypothetical protein Slin15195_G098450 [Septoria linicola]